MGAGKTTLARILAAHFGLDWVDADAELERRAGASVSEQFQRDGEPAFRERERELIASVCAGTGQVIATGGGAVLDAGTRATLAARCFVVHLDVSTAAQLVRLASDRSRPLLDCADRELQLERLAAQRGPLYREIARCSIDTSALSADTVAARVIDALEHRWMPA